MVSGAASNQKFSSWQDLVLADEKMEHLKKNTDTVFTSTHCSKSTTQNIALDCSKDDPHIVLLSVEQATGSISLFHHVQEVSGGIGSNFKANACVCLISAYDVTLSIPL